ncbi:MAG: hypothetical protein ACRENP_24145 [Longimicrobiales bacterium]
MKPSGLLLEAGLTLAALGMMLVVLGVIAGPFFYPGLFVLTAGLLLAATAGVLYVLP